MDKVSEKVWTIFCRTGWPVILRCERGCTGFDGRAVIGSWYGDRPAHLRLGGSFHRSRMRLISSQVSTIAPRFAGRWSQARRREVAWRMLAEIDPVRLITHRFPVSRADEAYDLLDRRPQEAVQVMLTY